MSLWDAIPAFARANKLRKAQLTTNSDETVNLEKIEETAGLADANLITSEMTDDTHLPLIDIDMDCALLPSSTKGHHHLYINKPMSFEQLMRLMEVMVEVGIVQEGFYKFSKERGYTTLRLPHVKKEAIKFEGVDEPFKKFEDPFVKLIKDASSSVKSKFDNTPEEW